jgi:hypothetical protein
MESLLAQARKKLAMRNESADTEFSAGITRDRALLLVMRRAVRAGGAV